MHVYILRNGVRINQVNVIICEDGRQGKLRGKKDRRKDTSQTKQLPQELQFTGKATPKTVGKKNENSYYNVKFEPDLYSSSSFQGYGLANSSVTFEKVDNMINRFLEILIQKEIQTQNKAELYGSHLTELIRMFNNGMEFLKGSIQLCNRGKL